MDPIYLERLAEMQDRAVENMARAQRMAEATDQASGLMLKIWFSHGPISTPSSLAAMQALSNRKAAIDAFQDVSAQLAEGLRQGGARYRMADEMLSANMDIHI